MNGNHTGADLELEIMAMLQRLKVAPIVMTRADDDGVDRYHWEFGSLRSKQRTFVDALEDALSQTMAYLWAVEEERVPDIPVSVRANMTEWNVELLKRRWERKQRERLELFGSA